MWALAAVLGMTAGASAAEEGWVVDFNVAKERAAAEGKDILMEFTGSDWCPPCINFKKTVLDSEIFKTGAPGSYILLKLDSPKDKSKQTPEEIAQYKTLSAAFKITGVPTVILADAKGRPFAKTVGYGGTPAEAYVKDLVAKTEIRKTRDDRLAKAEKAEGVDKAKLLNEAISAVDSETALSQYREIVDQIIVLDVENSAGLKVKYEGVINQVAIRATLQGIMRSASAGNIEDTAKKIDELIAEKNLQGEGLQEVLFAKAQLQFRGDKSKAKETLLIAQKAAPETPTAKQIDDILKRFFADEDKSEKKDDAKKNATDTKAVEKK